MVCHTGVGLTPTTSDGRSLRLSAGGLSDGLILLVDDETRSYWDHITGEAVHGPLVGSRLPVWPVEITTVASALAADLDLTLHRSNPRRLDPERLMTAAWAKRVGKSAVFPPGFRRTMSDADARRPEMEPGLGVVVGERARYYPLAALREGLVERWGDRTLRLGLRAQDRTPLAEWADDGDRPFQLFTRWYGFSRTFPDCEVFDDE